MHKTKEQNGLSIVDENGAAEILGVSSRWLQTKRLDGSGPRFVKLGRLVRYRLVDLENYLEENTRQSTCDPGTEGFL